MSKKHQQFNLVISLCLLILISLTTGYTVGYFKGKQIKFPQIQEVSDTNPKVSTVKLMKLSGNRIIGEIDGRRTRLVYSPKDIYELEPGQTFEIPIHEISLSAYYDASNIPPGIQYIASKSGKYYYHVLNPASLKLSPKNRLYFKNEEEAIQAGFKPKE